MQSVTSLVIPAGRRNQMKNDTLGKNMVRIYKDTVFRLLFSKAEHALSLYNSLNGTDYEDVSQLEFNTLENAIYMNVKNDLSFLIAHCINLYEHQSTLNPNLPLRDLFYVADLFQNLVKDKSIYSSKRIKIPNPNFVVFYNGVQDAPEHVILKLSDLYEMPTCDPLLELKVTFININPGMNEELKRKCPVLKDYMTYVETVRNFAKRMPVEKAAVRAVEQCIEENVLRDFLLSQKAEVVKMSIYEYDEEREIQLIREDERMEGQERINTLNRKLKEDNRMEDLIQSLTDSQLQNKLLMEYGI